MFIAGDLVIKKDGGNKMMVFEVKNEVCFCVWATDTIHSAEFRTDDLIKYTTYQSWLHQMERDDKIQEILKN